MTYVTTYLFPSYAIDRTYGVLADGKLFVQYSVRQPDDAKEYTYPYGSAHVVKPLSKEHSDAVM